MALEQFSNGASDTLNGSINNSTTSIVVNSAATFPTVPNFRILIGTELMLVTAVSGTTFTATRGVEGTTAASHSSGDTVELVLTSTSFELILASLLHPGGRLTLVSATPIMTSDQTAKGTIYYDTYKHRVVPVAGALYEITSDEISLILDSTNHVTTKLYDVFAVVVSGALKLVTGPAWSSLSARGTGAGTTELQLSNGLWTNKNALTHAYNNSVDYGSIPANAATYLGTFYTTAAAQTGMAYKPTAASGGSNPILGLYNAYNRESTSSLNRDSVSSYTYNSTTWRSTNGNNNNRVSFVDGLAQSEYLAECATEEGGGTNNTFMVGSNLNATTGAPGATGNQNANGSLNFQIGASERFRPALGFNFIQQMEACGAANSVTLWGTGAGGNSSWLNVTVDM